MLEGRRARHGPVEPREVGEAETGALGRLDQLAASLFETRSPVADATAACVSGRRRVVDERVGGVEVTRLRRDGEAAGGDGLTLRGERVGDRRAASLELAARRAGRRRRSSRARP